jgi:hypothetical protein
LFQNERAEITIKTICVLRMKLNYKLILTQTFEKAFGSGFAVLAARQVASRWQHQPMPLLSLVPR